MYQSRLQNDSPFTQFSGCLFTVTLFHIERRFNKAFASYMSKTFSSLLLKKVS